MPVTPIYLRRMTDAARLLVTPDAGEPIWATDTGKLYVGDGSTAGGIQIAGGQTLYLTDLLDSDGDTILEIADVGGTQVNHLKVFAALTGSSPLLQAIGSDATVALCLRPQGGFGTIQLQDASGNNALVTAGGGVNYLSGAGAATGNPPQLAVLGSDTDIDLEIFGKGAGHVEVADVRMKAGSVFKRRRIYTQVDPNSATTFYTDGGAALVDSTPTTPTTVNTRDKPFHKHVNNIAVGSGPLQTNYSSTQRRWDPHYECVMRTGDDLTSLRIWAGMFDQLPDNVNSSGAVHFAAFRYATPVDGTAFWRAISTDGTTEQATTTTTAIATETEYKLRIECELAVPEIRYYIDDVLVATHATNLPALDTMQGHGIRFKPLATAGGSRFFEWSYVMVTMN